MPIEIKELVIRATTIADDASSGDLEASIPVSDTDRALIVEECVRQVLKTLERKRQR